jgi:hypothetical protein
VITWQSAETTQVTLLYEYKQLYINWINRLLTKKKRANKVNGLIQSIHPRRRQQFSFSPSRPSPPLRKPRRAAGMGGEGRQAKPDLCTCTMAASTHAAGSSSPQAAQIGLRARLAGSSSPFGIAGEGEGCRERWEERGAQAGEDRSGGAGVGSASRRI